MPSIQIVRSLASSLTDGILVFEEPGLISYANESARHLISHFGVVTDPLKTNAFFSSAVTDAISDLLSGKQGEEIEFNQGVWPKGVEYGMPTVLKLHVDRTETDPVVIGVLRKAETTDFSRAFEDRKQQLLELIGVMGIVAHKIPDEDDVLHVGLKEIGKCLGWELGHVYTLSPETDKFVPTGIWYEKNPGQYDEFKAATDTSQFEKGEGLSGRVWRTGSPVWINDVGTDDQFLRRHKVKQLNLTTAIGIPVLSWGKTVAVLEFFSDVREEEDRRLTELLTQICAQIGHAHERNSALTSANWEQRRFDAFLQASSDWFWMMGPDLRFSSWHTSDASSDITPPLGKTRWELASASDLADEDKWRHHRSDLENRRPFRNFEFQFVNTDGQNYWLNSTGIPLFNDDGEFEGYWGATSDVSQHKLMETQFVQARKMEAVGKLTGGVAHDFNNLLSVVIWNLDMALEEMELDEFATDILERAQSAAERGVELTNRLLAFSRKQVLDPSIIKTADTLNEFTNLLGGTLGESIVINTDFAEDTWPVEVDRSEMENTVLNLAINARDALEGSGEISITARNIVLEPDTVSEFSIVEAAEFVHLSVTDSGSGMTEETRLQVFEPFFTTKISGLGTGLGLSTIYGFVKQSSGFINITSELGVGTTVDIYLPRYILDDQTGEEIADQKQPDKGIPRGKGERILVVEDNDDVRLSVTAILEGLGYKVDSVATGQAGLDFFESGSNVDALLTDVMLGGDLSGRDVSLYVEENFPEVAVLHMSGYAENEIVHNGFVEEGVRMLQKPFTKAQLAQQIRALLDGGLQA